MRIESQLISMVPIRRDAFPVLGTRIMRIESQLISKVPIRRDAFSWTRRGSRASKENGTLRTHILLQSAEIRMQYNSALSSFSNETNYDVAGVRQLMELWLSPSPSHWKVAFGTR
jgi:hypothetical protein